MDEQRGLPAIQRPLFSVAPPGRSISKSRLEAAGKRLREMRGSPGKFDPARWEVEIALVDEWRRSFMPALNATNMWLRSATEAFPATREVLWIKSRSKQLSSIVSKLCDKPTLRLPQMEDIAGARVLVRTAPAQEALSRWLSQVSSRRVAVVEVDDYVRHPRPGGYRAMHLHTERTVQQGKTLLGPWKVEIQIRTERQQWWADTIEALDDAYGSDLKHERDFGHWNETMRALADGLAEEDETGSSLSLPAGYDGGNGSGEVEFDGE